MTAKSTKTIDDLGYKVYLQYEEGRKSLEKEYINDSKNVASHLQTDIFEPILISDHQALFDLARKNGTWSILPPPDKYNDQKKRLFTYQLAPKLGPEEYLEMQIERIEDQVGDEEKKSKAENSAASTKDKEKNQANDIAAPPKAGGASKERLFSWQNNEDIKNVAKDAQSLIELLKSINMLNKIMIDVNSERYRYSKG